MLDKPLIAMINGWCFGGAYRSLFANAQGYLIRAWEAAIFFDSEGCQETTRQLIDDKTCKPRGYRGSPMLDVRAGAQIRQVSAVFLIESSLVELDPNPVILHPEGEGARCADVRWPRN